jgi:flagellar motor switch protein FliG
MNRDSPVRKAAILISVLDDAAADALLDQMDPEQAAKVRNAVLALDGVSEEEQQQVLAEFLGKGPRVASAEGGVKIELSSHVNLPPAAAWPAATQSGGGDDRRPAPNFEFLKDADPSAVAQILAREQPQVAAVVISRLPPESAARVLERLPPAVATEALSRMAWLSDPAPEALLDLERELRRLLAPYCDSGSAAAGASGIQAILASLPAGRRSELLRRLAREDELLAGRLAGSLGELDSRSGQSEVLSFRIRGQDGTEPAAASAPRSQGGSMSLEFEDLARLSDRDLARLGQAADLQWLALALIECDERFAARMLRGIPDQHAERVRQQLKQPGPLRLRDIDQAQRKLLQLASYLSRHGEISLPKPRRFVAAA